MQATETPTKLNPEEQLENRIHHLQKALWIVQSELKSYAFLFMYLGDASLEDGTLHGVGHRLDKLQLRLERISDHLSKLQSKS